MMPRRPMGGLQRARMGRTPSRPDPRMPGGGKPTLPQMPVRRPPGPVSANQPGGPQPGGLAQLMQRFSQAQGAQGARPGMSSGFGPNAPYRPPGAPPAAFRGPQQAPAARKPFATGNLPGRGPNALLRTSQAPSGQAGQRLNHLMGRMAGGRRAFAKGGSVKRALEALQRTRSALEGESDPNIDDIAAFLASEVPQARRTALKMKELDRVGPEVDAEDLRQAWLQVHEELRQLEGRLEMPAQKKMTDEELRSFFTEDRRRARHLRELLAANPDEPNEFARMSPDFRRDLMNYIQYQPELLEAGALDDLDRLRSILVGERTEMGTGKNFEVERAKAEGRPIRPDDDELGPDPHGQFSMEKYRK